MKGIVSALAVSPEGHRIISVETDYGVLSGAWDGEAPNLHATVFFEIEFEPVSEPVVECQAEFTATSPVPGDVLLVGRAEAWLDGVLDLRIGSSLVQVELPNAPADGSWLVVRGHRLMLFDTNL